MSNVWIRAARPKTLFVSISPVITAVAVATGKGEDFLVLPAIICFFFAVLAQVVSNFVNDYADFAKGADGEDRLGPERMVASGQISPRAMLAGLAVVSAAAALLGLSLIHWGGWWLLPVGAVILVGAYSYSTGPWPLSYHGLGDVAVVLFYGFVPVVFTYYVICGHFAADVCIAGLAMGLVADELLIVNNYRDAEQDRAHGKRTSVVILGKGAARAAFLLNPVAAVGLGFFFAADRALWGVCGGIFTTLAFLLWRKLRKTEGAALNGLLAKASLLTVIFALMTLLCCSF